MQLLTSLPGVAAILAIIIEREIGTIERFPSAGHLAAYSGLVPKVHSSGGKTRYGHMRKQANNYLKWAFRAAPRRASKQPTLSSLIGITHHGDRRRFPRSMKGFPAERGTPSPWEQSPGTWLNPHSGSSRKENLIATLPYAGRTLPSRREGVPNLYPLRYVN
jgi:hypothetical protein